MTEINIDHFLTVLKNEVASYQVPVVDLIAVQTRDPFKVLVATILSARTKDETTAKASERLFKRAPDSSSLATLTEQEIRGLIYPVGFFKNKAKYLAALPTALEEMGGEVPSEIDELLKLPGVGRKTANLVVAVAFGKPAICVDTHVHRIMNIWGYVDTKTAEQTEMALRKKLPEKYWITVNSILVAFGQGTCKPVGPRCDVCILAEQCPQIGVTPRRLPGAKTGKKEALRLISWNVNGIRAVEKKGFVDIVQGLGPDIFAIQETKAHADQLSDSLKQIDGYTAYFAQAQKKGYSGLAIYSRLKPLQVITGLGKEEFDNEGRLLTLEFNSFYLVNGYFPNGNGKNRDNSRIPYKLRFYRRLFDVLEPDRKRGAPILVVGDFTFIVVALFAPLVTLIQSVSGGI